MHIVYYYSFCFGWQGSRWKNKRTLGGRHVCKNVNGILKLMSCAHFLQFLYLVVGVICNLICLDLPLSICYRANRLMLTHVQKQLGQNVELYCGIASHHILILIFVLPSYVYTATSSIANENVIIKGCCCLQYFKDRSRHILM